ncbi:hypothetical protein BAQU_1257 [Bifidobacterium aquikefiri]|uniref:Uncharacterized protein n=1 Tax=Bifidobacterium aquikefiri TaxID=1653207 RepID=A0A261G7N2_9BIFI|nr:hypothetical protein BAQU_1257 [Bifidobacterium aquikefiri]
MRVLEKRHRSLTVCIASLRVENRFSQSLTLVVHGDVSGSACAFFVTRCSSSEPVRYITYAVIYLPWLDFNRINGKFKHRVITLQVECAMNVKGGEDGFN